MRSTLALLVLAATQLTFGPCDKSDDKKDDKSSSSTKDDDKDKSKKDKKKGDDDDDDDDKSASKKKKKKGDDDDDDDDKPTKKKKKKGDDDDDDDDGKGKKKGGDALSLNCFDSVNSLGAKVKGTSFSGTCLKGCTSGSIWGSGPYTADSPICVAAVHAGVITAKDGGDVDVTIGPGLSSYKGSTKNGVTTASWGAFPKSFSFDGADATPPPPDTTAIFAGSYSSNWGTTVFKQTGNNVSGTYPGGTLACTVVKEVSLGCQWFESGDSGRAFLTRNATTGVISGTWGSGSSSSDGGSWTFIPIKK